MNEKLQKSQAPPQTSVYNNDNNNNDNIRKIFYQQAKNVHYQFFISKLKPIN